MNDIATTTTIRDTVSISENRGAEESFDVSFSQDSLKYDGNYSVTNVENYPSFVYFIKNTLSNFDLLNEDEIIMFIIEHLGLIELIENAALIIKNHFPKYSFGLEFEEDPEISSLNKLVLYVKGDEGSFDEDWEEVKKVNREIRKLSLYDDSVKSLFSVDLW
ncbi:hypothetical protein [Methanobrevibacter ruminantium]|uniref:hypothetical protein n=1 Tax=Methanobrevibacter ruminantium TaxID=83816 RepID=UPI0026E99AB9|nr:hypothetical protein [Methanobrevibacter ruminantium]